MKRFLSVLFTATLLFALEGKAQVPDSEKSLATRGSGNNMNFRFSPLGLLVGILNGDLQFKMSNQWTMGPSALVWNLKVPDITLNATGAALSGMYYFDEVFEDSWYVSPAVGYISLTTKEKENLIDYEGNYTGLHMALGAGYIWHWESFNLSLGANWFYLLSGNISKKDAAGNPKEDSSLAGIPSVRFDFMMGFTF